MKLRDAYLRDAPLPPLLAALGTDVRDPRCPACHGPLEIGGDDRSGFSFSCRGRCRLAALGFAWAPSFAAELWRSATIDEARARIVAGIAEQEARANSPVARIDALLAGAGR